MGNFVDDMADNIQRMFGTRPHVFDERTDYKPVQGLPWKWFEKHEVVLAKRLQIDTHEWLKKGEVVTAELMPYGAIYLSYDGEVVKSDAKLGVDFNLNHL